MAAENVVNHPPALYVVLELDAPVRVLMDVDSEASELQLREYLARETEISAALELLGVAA